MSQMFILNLSSELMQLIVSPLKSNDRDAQAHAISEDDHLNTDESAGWRAAQACMEAHSFLRLEICKAIGELVMHRVDDLSRFPRNATIRRLNMERIRFEETVGWMGGLLGVKYKGLNHVHEATFDISCEMAIDGSLLRMLAELCPLIKKLTLIKKDGIRTRGYNMEFFTELAKTPVRQLQIPRGIVFTSPYAALLSNCNNIEDLSGNFEFDDEGMEVALSLLRLTRLDCNVLRLTRPVKQRTHADRRPAGFPYNTLVHLSAAGSVRIKTQDPSKWKDRGWFDWNELRTPEQLADLTRVLTVIDEVPPLFLSEESVPCAAFYKALASLREGGWIRHLSLRLVDDSRAVFEAVESIARALPDCRFVTLLDPFDTIIASLKEFQSLVELVKSPNVNVAYDNSNVFHLPALKRLQIGHLSTVLAAHPSMMPSRFATGS